MDDEADNQIVRDKLFAAIIRKKFKLAQILIEGGVAVNTKLSTGITPLMAVCDAVVDEEETDRKKKLILCMLKNGAQINSIDRMGRTSLHYAYICGDNKIINLLVSKGAKRNVRDINGQIPEFYTDNSHRRNTFHNNSPLRVASSRRDSVASMVNIPTEYRLWDSREFLDSILDI